MTALQSMLHHDVVQTAGWALLHFLWQGCLIGLLLFCAQVLGARQSAQMRYRSACAALLLMALAPLVTMNVLRGPSVVNTTLAQRLEPFQTDRWSTATSFEAFTPSWPSILNEKIQHWLPWIMAGWLCGVCLLSLRLVGGVFYTRRLTRRGTAPVDPEWQERLLRVCQQLRISQSVRLLESACVQVPTVIGWLRPVILLPASTLTGLTTMQLEAILAHELAHIRRQDYFVNLLQTAVETLLFYHPAVWWVSWQVRVEREHCCDDVAVTVQGNALTYARALAELELLRAREPKLALAANGGSLLERIERVLGRSRSLNSQPASWLAGAMVVTSLVGLAAVAQGDVFSGQAKGFFDDLEKLKAPASTEYRPVEINSMARSISQATGNEHRVLRISGASITSPAERQKVSYPELDFMAMSYARLQNADKRDDKQSKGDESSSAQDKSKPAKADYIGELRRLGYTNLSVDDLIELKSHGVSPEFVEGLKEQGLANLSVEQLVKLRSHGVSPTFIRELKASGYSNLGVDQLLSTRMHGLTPEFVTQMAALGFARLPLEALISARQHGVGPEFVKDLQSAGYAQLPLEDLIKARSHGVSGEFVKGLQSAGLKNLAFDDLVKARQHGLNAEFVKTFQQLGYGNLSLEQLINLRSHGVNGEFVQGIRQEGYEVATIDELIRLRNHGINVEFIRRLKSQGFPKLSIDQLIKLRSSGF